MKQKISKCFFDARVRMLLLLLISTIYAQAQSGRIVTGVVKDATGETVIGVNVTVKGNAALGTITDLDGKYSLNVPAQKSTLVFSFIGYQTVEKTIDANARTLNVTLVEDSKLLDEVVVVGYGTMKRKGFIGSINPCNIPYIPFAPCHNNLHTRIAGQKLRIIPGCRQIR